MKPLRIGIYGGAFDPPHRAHVGLAQAAVAQLGLDLLYVVPTGQPWMKTRQLTSAEHRLRMAELAFTSVPQVVVSDCEVRRSGITYTMDTLLTLQAQHPQAVWFLVLGQDLLPTLPRWQQATALSEAAQVAVLQRPQEDAPALQEVAERVQQELPALQVVFLQAPSSTISSTAVREGLQARASLSNAQRVRWLRDFVPEPVAEYINKHHLYLD